MGFMASHYLVHNFLGQELHIQLRMLMTG